MKGTYILTAMWLLVGSVQADDDRPIDVGSQRQLFVDRHLIDELDDAQLILHQPVRREVAIANDHPWEKFGVSYMVAFKDGEKFRAWYRCDAGPLDREARRQVMTAYAESTDGIHWDKPSLGLVEFAGSKQNNLVWDGPGANMAVFKDENPAAPADERYKAIVRTEDVYALVSPDGLKWRLLQDKPILTEGPFDSHNIAFWDSNHSQYVAYTRGVWREGKLGRAMSASFRNGVRGVRRATSDDFRNWSKLESLDMGDAPLEHLYTNATVIYDRAPGMYLMFPSRFVDTRTPDPAWKYNGVNDIVMFSSRDGLKFERTFKEAFLRPGLDQGNWHDRALYMERGILETSPTELSMYAMENWRLDSVRIRRLTLRPDGFASVEAPYSGGTLVTRPFTFSGERLRLNYSTSAVGSVQVEVQDAEGDPIPGFTLDECKVLYGDQLDAPVTWKAGGDVSSQAGRAVRLRLVMHDADVFAFRFASKNAP